MKIDSPPPGLNFRGLRCPDGHFQFNAKATSPTVEIFDAIGRDGVTANRVSAALRSIGQRPVTVEINSPGGDYFEAATIFNQLVAHPGKVTVRILGLAASSASLIAMAGDQIEIARNAQLMIHNAWVVVIGDRRELANANSWLTKIDTALAEIYAARSGQSVAEMATAMDQETFYTSAEAVEIGLVDTEINRDAVSPLGVRNAGPANKRAFEHVLRDAGFSRNAALKVAAAGWDALGGSPDGPDLSALAKRLDSNREELRRLVR
ncbi:MAG: head maturation protease, ClpP-related [Alphaproteobacteria bacterium]